MKLRGLLEKVEIVTIAVDLDIEVHGISYDTRKLCAGEAFVAVRGYKSDGHQYIEEAVSKAAACIVCEKAPETQVPHIIVKDSRKALAAISAAWFGYPAEKLISVGITGTNGKTTTATMLKHVIEKCTNEKVGLIGTNANIIGDKELRAELTTPESYEIQELLAMMVEADCRYVVMEVSSHALYLSRVHGIEFEVGVYTNLSRDHLDFHDTMEKYAEVKAQLFRNCRKAAINIDDEYAPIMIKNANCPVLTFAINNYEADLVGKNIKLYSDRVDFCALAIGSLNRVEMGIPGLFMVYNALAVISAAVLLGFDYEMTTSSLETCSGVKGRVEVVPTDRDFTIMIDYAHTPDALENIIKTSREITRGRVVTLFGCGGDRDRTKREKMGEIAAKYSDYVIVTTDNPRTEEPGAIINEILEGVGNSKTPHQVIENRREAIFWALENAKRDDVLILAGKGHETYQIFGEEKVHFDEREVVAEFFAGAKR